MSQESETAEGTPRISFNYRKSPAFRTVHSDGVFGGVSPKGLITMTFFSERAPIPQQVTHELVAGRLGKELEELRVSLEGILREAEVCVVLDIDMARVLVGWLQEKIGLVDARASQVPVAPGTPVVPEDQNK
jgi:hypothetical protein